VLKETAGKAVEGYSRINFNALPEAYIPKPRPLSELLYPPALLVGILAVAAVGYLLFNSMGLTDALRERAAANDQLVVTLNASVAKQRQALEAEKTALSGKVTVAEARADALDARMRAYGEDKQDINNDLGQIHSTPGGVNLGSISHSGSMASVDGWGADEKAVFAYARQLRATGRWSLVTIDSMSEDGIQTAFSISLYR